MNETLTKQAEQLLGLIDSEQNQYKKILYLDALRSVYIQGDEKSQAEIVAKKLLNVASTYVRCCDNPQRLEHVLNLMFDSYVTRAANDFHSYLMALEWEREPKERFYQPRMTILRPIVNAMTDMMVCDKYDMMMLSMPPGTGKSTLGLFFLSWVVGREPEKCNLAIGYSTPMAKSFFSRVSAIDEDVEYTYHKIFPELNRVYTSAKELELDFSNKKDAVKKPFVSLTCASVAGSLTGRTRCENLLYCDDMVEGAETAMSPTRLDKLWTLYTSNARSRKKEGCKELHIGTRWSMSDPIGKLQLFYADDSRCLQISMPALNEKGESNFEYKYGVGFSSNMFEDIRKTANKIEWNALYQQKPIEAEGLLFPVDEVKRFSINDVDLEKNPPDDIFAFCDVAFGGTDYLAMPIMAQWSDDPPLCLDVVFMRGSYQVTQPVVVGKIIQWGVQRVIFESNNGGDFYSKDIKEQLKNQNYCCFVKSQPAPTRMSKEARIIQHSPAILSFCYRKPDEYPVDNMYRNFMTNVVTYTAQGENEHDDAPDSLAGVAAMLRSKLRASVKIKRRLHL